MERIGASLPGADTAPHDAVAAGSPLELMTMDGHRSTLALITPFRPDPQRDGTERPFLRPILGTLRRPVNHRPWAGTGISQNNRRISPVGRAIWLAGEELHPAV